MQISLNVTLIYDAENELLDHEIQTMAEALVEVISSTNEVPREFAKDDVVIRLEIVEPQKSIELSSEL